LIPTLIAIDAHSSKNEIPWLPDLKIELMTAGDGAMWT
jgi:hypothetical protein